MRISLARNANYDVAAKGYQSRGKPWSAFIQCHERTTHREPGIVVHYLIVKVPMRDNM